MSASRGQKALTEAMRAAPQMQAYAHAGLVGRVQGMDAIYTRTAGAVQEVSFPSQTPVTIEPKKAHKRKRVTWWDGKENDTERADTEYQGVLTCSTSDNSARISTNECPVPKTVLALQHLKTQVQVFQPRLTNTVLGAMQTMHAEVKTLVAALRVERKKNREAEALYESQKTVMVHLQMQKIQNEQAAAAASAAAATAATAPAAEPIDLQELVDSLQPEHLPMNNNDDLDINLAELFALACAEDESALSA